ncbi:protein PBDC1 [Patella vulgata]|uniref:protein PBDC1 n=1 Tax=Patella vulgata TaxID=6465 RepID=UPI00217FE59A|nr:protein PBDC1 [Patella vulgata]
MSLSHFSAAEVQAVGASLQSPEDLGNREDVELQWAIKASNHAETYFNLITSVDPSVLRLTKQDDEIYSQFRTEFKDFKVDIIDVAELKSAEAKIKWRAFCESFKDMDDYNYGSLLRIDCKKDYTESNSIFALRIQFLAIEIARNREGYNADLRKTKGIVNDSKDS